MLLMTASIAIAQSDSTKFIKRINLGMITGISASSTFQGNGQPFSLGYGLLGNVVIVTSKSYHNFIYGFGNNSARMINGYFLPKKWDVYLAYSKVINANQNYLGLGIEKMLLTGDVKSFLFLEEGTDFNGTNSFTVGVLMSFQNTLWKRK